MPVLPLVTLPVSAAAHGGPLLLRVDFRSRHTTLYVRRESDKQNWVCTVRTLQEILAPTQQARPLDVEAVITCLYHRFAVDASDPHAPLELRRVEVAFAQPDTWTDSSRLNYRLTMRIAVRATAVATVLAAAAPTPRAAAVVVDGGNQAEESPSAAAVPVSFPIPTEIADETIVFGFNFEPTKDDIERHTPKIYGSAVRRCATLRLFGAAFPHAFLNWTPSPQHHDLVVVEKDRVVKPTNAVSFQPAGSAQGGDLVHTVLQYAANAAPKSHVQVAVLPGSACLVEGMTLAIREVNSY